MATACAACGKEGTTYKCSSCSVVRYCSHKCQMKHWKAEHKRNCVPSKEPVYAIFACPVSGKSELDAVHAAYLTLAGYCMDDAVHLVKAAELHWLVVRIMTKKEEEKHIIELTGYHFTTRYPDLKFAGPECYTMSSPLEEGSRPEEYPMPNWTPRRLPRDIQSMQPRTGDQAETERQMAALEGAAVARSDGEDWSPICAYLAANAVAVARVPLSPEVAMLAEAFQFGIDMSTGGSNMETPMFHLMQMLDECKDVLSDKRPSPFNGKMVRLCALLMYTAKVWAARLAEQVPCFTEAEIMAQLRVDWYGKDEAFRKRYAALAKRLPDDPRNAEKGEVNGDGIRMVIPHDIFDERAIQARVNAWEVEHSMEASSRQLVKIRSEWYRATNAERRRFCIELHLSQGEPATPLTVASLPLPRSPQRVYIASSSEQMCV